MWKSPFSGPLASKGDFWLSAFDSSPFSAALHWDDYKQFLLALVRFLQDPQFYKYRNGLSFFLPFFNISKPLDIRLNESGHIVAIKMSIRIRKLDPKNDQPRADFLRNVMTQSGCLVRISQLFPELSRSLGFSGFVYDTRYNIDQMDQIAPVSAFYWRISRKSLARTWWPMCWWP